MPLPTVGLLWSNLLYSLAIIVVSIITVLQDKSYRRKTLHSRYIYFSRYRWSYLQLFPILSALRSRSVFSLFFFSAKPVPPRVSNRNGKWKGMKDFFRREKKNSSREKKKKKNKKKMTRLQFANFSFSICSSRCFLIVYTQVISFDQIRFSTRF